MFEHRYGIKLKATTADAAILKLLRKHFPNQSLSELRSKIQAHDYVFLSDMEKYDGERRMAKLLREFDKAGIETELFEEHRYTPAPWQSEPMSREFFHNILQRNREIERETMLDMEREVEGFVSPGAMADRRKTTSLPGGGSRRTGLCPLPMSTRRCRFGFAGAAVSLRRCS